MRGYDPDFGHILVKGPRGRGEAPPPILLWSAVYLANLPFPALMGFHVAYGPGLIGMGLGVAGLYAAGRWACSIRPWGVRMVSYGGTLVAALQLLPVLQIVAGLMGVATASVLSQGVFPPGGQTLTALGGLIATIVTGLALIACAGIAGVFMLAIRYAVSPSFRTALAGDRGGKCEYGR